MNNISKQKAKKFDRNFLTWMLVAQVTVIAACVYLVLAGFFTTLPV